jgi:hypothetical protein
MSMRLIGLVLGLAIVSVVSNAQTITVNYNGGSGAPNVIESDGITPLADGNAVEIGYFTAGYDIQGNAGSLSALATARQNGTWHLFDSTSITHNLLLPAGSFSGQGNATSGFTGNQIDLWIFQTANGAAPAADLSNVTAWGLFSSTTNAGPSRSWIFQAPGIPGVDNISTLDVDIFYHGGAISPNDQNGHLEVAPAAVPEPGTTALFGLGLVSAVIAIRRARRV